MTVIKFNGTTTNDINPDEMLNATVGLLDEIVIIGTGKDGRFYLASSIGDVFKVNWLIDRAKTELMDMHNE